MFTSNPSLAGSIREEMCGILVFVLVIWGVQLADILLPMFRLNDFGLTPRTLQGLPGIVTMPFLHKGWGHLFSNTLALVIMLALLVGSKARTGEIVAVIIFMSGGLLWIFGRPDTHIGVSGLVFGLIAFLVISGLLEQRLVSLLVSLLVGAMYGWTFLRGILPFETPVSWDGHLLGSAAGTLVAFVTVKELLEDPPAQNESPTV